MSRRVSQLLLLLACGARGRGEGVTLPPCPTGVQYGPASLPMHCRLVVKQNNDPYIAGIPGPPGKPMPLPVPFPGMPSMPNMPNFPNVPGMGFPGMQGVIPGMAVPFPGGMAMGPPKLPVIVMPVYQPGRRPGPAPRPGDASSDTDDSGFDDRKLNEHRLPDSSADGSLDRMPSSSDEGFWSNRRSGRRKAAKKRGTRRSRARRRENREDLLTPIIQYVTKDGYVIFEKKITKGEAKSWLDLEKMSTQDGSPEPVTPPGSGTAGAAGGAGGAGAAEGAETAGRTSKAPLRTHKKIAEHRKNSSKTRKVV